MKQKRSTGVISLTRASVIAALYVALTYLSFFMGLSSGVIQFRLSEALCVLPLFMPEAVVGVTLGCFIANLVTGCAVWDIIFGTLATLIGVLGSYLMRRVKFSALATIPTILSNMLIIPFVLRYVYGEVGSLWFFALTVGIGEIVCAGILGTVLAVTLKKTDIANIFCDR